MAAGPIGILGGGAWGTALAQAAAAAGRHVILSMRDPNLADEVEGSRVNLRHLPEITLDPRIRVTAAIEGLRAAEAVLLVVPAQAMREAIQALPPDLITGVPLVICAKGIERASGRFL